MKKVIRLTYLSHRLLVTDKVEIFFINFLNCLEIHSRILKEQHPPGKKKILFVNRST